MGSDETLKLALKFTLKWEGGVSNHKNDKGGLTNKGVTQAVYDEYRKSKKLPTRPVTQMTDDECLDIYKNRYFIPACSNIKNPRLAVAVFDFAVNSGVSRAKRYLKLKNPMTYKDFNNLREDYFNKIVKADPSQAEFIKGWLNRLNDLRKYVETLPEFSLTNV